MHRSIHEIKGIGPAREAILSEQGIVTVADLLYHFPRRYIDRSLQETTLMTTGQITTLMVRVKSKYLAHGKRSRLIVHCRTLNGEALSLLWFRGVNYFIRLFHEEQLLVVSGKLEFFGGMQMVHPDFEPLDEEDEKNLIHVGRIVPLYSTTEAMKKKGMDSKGLRKMVDALFKDPSLCVVETIPEELLKERGYPDRLEALKNIHFPENDESLKLARERMKFEELYLFNVLMRKKQLHRRREKRELWPLPPEKSPLSREFLAHLPFRLTENQEKAIAEILEECESDHAGAFLLQGDVGSGKTVVALSIALHYLENGIQVAFMAPTEVLARQHYRSIVNLLGMRGNLRIEIFTGQDKKKSRELVLEGLAKGDVDLVVGTHSLIEDGVLFESLGLVIVDEQHRFGVEQRERLRRKGKNPDVLAMTATPIPRSLCLTEFSDLRLVTLKEKPAGRKPIRTMWFQEDRRNGVYNSIRKYVEAGRQCFIVYPVIDESEKSDLRAATEAFEELKGVHFPNYKVELLHGRMKPAEKERVMGDFRENRIQILVTTTVIEVGVDVPNATIMVVEHADRFGISQLHQLRGRVGRGEAESFCVLMTGSDFTEEARERLEAVVQSEDGFYLSEVDMKLRGPGELLGLRQHGVADFRLANLVEDRELAERAFFDARSYPEVNEEGKAFILNHFSEGVVVFSN